MPTGAGANSAAGRAGDVRAGGAFFELYGKDKLSPALDKAKKKTSEFGQFMAGVGRKLLAGATGMAAGAGGLVGTLFFGGVRNAADVARMAQQFQLPIDLMNKLKHAADEAGVSVDEVMNDTTGRFTKSINSAPGLNEADAQKALQMQKDWNNALRDLQSALLPLVGTTAEFTASVARLTKAMREKGGRGAIEGVALDFVAGADVGPIVGRINAAIGAALAPARAMPNLNANISANAVRGGFNTFGAMGQFGFGSGVMQQTELMKQLVRLAEDNPDKAAAALARALTPK